MGLASWGGPGSSDPPTLDDLIAAFDVLDGSEAFVHPDVMAAVAETGKAAEKAALATVTELLGVLARRLDADPASRQRSSALRPDSRFMVRRARPDEADGGGPRCRPHTYRLDVESVRGDGMGPRRTCWATTDSCRRVRDGDSVWAEQCAMESTRMAQRSIMSRFVLDPVTLSDGSRTFEVDSRSDDRHSPAANEHELGSRIRQMGPVALESPPARRSVVASQRSNW